ncbi:caspase family protein [Runella sp.]|jgi:hypothetical protein|uniref:caspase family protein n=1 Tax=Runella sp. TaxID=1960881 RepID=UPI00260FAC27|nr:caspase family protein [Runella sp.]
MKYFFQFLLFCLFSFSALAQPKTGLNRTWVFMVGVLEWADANEFASFEKKARVDAKIHQFFQKSGLPDHQIMYLKDKQASTAAVKDAFIPFLQQAQKGDMLFFYYCGHGYKNGKDKVCFANYKGADWSVEEIVKTVNQHFAGNTAFFTADCCNSGGLADEVRKYPTKNFMALNSVVPTDVSTGNWTFSNALLYALQGENFVDTDNNQQITLGELSNYIDEEMAIVEGQKAAYYIPKSMNAWAITTRVSPKKNKRIGERVSVNYDGQDYLGFIIDSGKDNNYNVRFYSYTNNETDWVAASRLKSYSSPKNFPIGASVNVYYEDDKKWYPAKVVKKFSSLHFVHYDDYGSEWDAWVSPDNIKKANSSK